MDTSSKIIVGTFAALCALWDAITTYGGMYQIAGSGGIALILTFFVNGAIIISCAPIQNSVIQFILVIIVLTAVACDAYTAYHGNFSLFTQGTLDESSKIGIAIGMSVICVGSSFLVSYLIFHRERNRQPV